MRYGRLPIITIVKTCVKGCGGEESKERENYGALFLFVFGRKNLFDKFLGIHIHFKTDQCNVYPKSGSQTQYLNSTEGLKSSPETSFTFRERTNFLYF